MKKFMDPKTLRPIARVLLIIGGLNRWLLWLFNLDLVALVFGYGFFARVIYTIVGIATVYVILYPKQASHTPLRK